MKLSALYSAEMSSLPTPISPQRASSVSVMTNACLVIIKLIAGFTTGSIALITDGLHSFIDLIAAAIALISIRVAARPADATHEYGHGKLENLSALIEGVLILVGAAVIVEQGIVRLLHPHPLHDIGFGLVVAAIAVSVVSALVRFLRRVAARSASPALAGDAAHMTADVVSSLAVLLGLILVKVTGYVRADAVVALAVAVVVVASGLRVIWRAANELLDRSLPPDELAALELTIASALGEAAISYHKLRARHSGATHYVDLHLQFRPGTSLEVAHQTSHRLTDAITGQLERADVTIHLEPGRDASDNVRLR